MLSSRKRSVVTLVAVVAGGLVFSACTSTGTTSGPVSTTNEIRVTTQKAAVSPGSSPNGGVQAASADVKLGALRVDAKRGTPSAEVTITNHSSKRSNYVVDVSIISADGKTKLDAAMVSAPGLAPGQTTKRAAHFTTTQALPRGAKLNVVGVARLVA